MKTKNLKEKGITLIALVITIVVLIILTTISINMILNDNGIIGAAEKSKELYQNASSKEQSEVGNIEKLLEKYDGKWRYDQATQTVTKGDLTLKIGDYVDYNHVTGATEASYTSTSDKNGYANQTFTVADYNSGWRVLGVNNNGQLELIAEDVVPLIGGWDDSNKHTNYTVRINSENDLELYSNLGEEFKTISKIYSQGKGAIKEKGRILTAEDINNITGYNPETAGYGSGSMNEYGNEITYTKTASGLTYIGTKYPTTLQSEDNHYIFAPTENGWKTSLAVGESVDIKNNFYSYNPITLHESSSGKTGLESTSQAYNMLFENTSTSYKFNYWLGSTFMTTYENRIEEIEYRFTQIDYGYFNVYNGQVGVYSILFNSDTGFEMGEVRSGVRPVVTLNSSVELKDSKTTRDDCTLWNIQ